MQCLTTVTLTHDLELGHHAVVFVLEYVAVDHVILKVVHVHLHPCHSTIACVIGELADNPYAATWRHVPGIFPAHLISRRRRTVSVEDLPHDVVCVHGVIHVHRVDELPYLGAIEHGIGIYAHVVVRQAVDGEHGLHVAH